MELGIFTKIAMFISSYSFLFLALAMKFSNNFTFWVLLAISCLGVFITLVIVNTKINADEANVVHVVAKNDQVAGYLVTYILPFSGFSFITLSDQLSLLVLFLTIGILYIKADLIYINPTLMLLGYNIYDVTLENGTNRVLLTKRKINELKLISNIKFYELHDRQIIIEREG